jgi:hypothetical protein
MKSEHCELNKNEIIQEIEILNLEINLEIIFHLSDNQKENMIVDGINMFSLNEMIQNLLLIENLADQKQMMKLIVEQTYCID